MVSELLFFMEVLVGGLLAGTMYSLVALGFVLILKHQQLSTSLGELWFFSQCLLFVVSCKILIYTFRTSIYSSCPFNGGSWFMY